VIELSAKTLSTALQTVAGVVERRHLLPIFSHVLVQLREQKMAVTGTDLEIEISYQIPLPTVQHPADFEVTLPCRKVLDICKALAEHTQVRFKLDGERRVSLETEQGQFLFNSHDPHEFPRMPRQEHQHQFEIQPSILLGLLEKTYFAIASEDVRHYLTGLLLEIDVHEIRAVATDGHRLALAKQSVEGLVQEKTQILIPRKAISEMLRLLAAQTVPIQLSYDAQHLWLSTESGHLATKLIDSRFPPYGMVIPRDTRITLNVTKDEFKRALQRVAILSSDTHRGVELLLRSGQIKLSAHNLDQEHAEEVINIEYSGEEFSVVLNAQYVLDILSVLPDGVIQLQFLDTQTGVLVGSTQAPHLVYVVMPMQP